MKRRSMRTNQENCGRGQCRRLNGGRGLTEYEEDKAVTSISIGRDEDGEFVEVQGSGQEATFSNDQLSEIVRSAAKESRS